MFKNYSRSLTLVSAGAAVLLVLGVSPLGCSKKEKEAGAPAPASTQAGQPAQPQAASTPVPREIFSGREAKVVKVIQANTLQILQGKKKFDVKLYGVVLRTDKPAINAKAKKFVSDLLLGKQVLVDLKKRDRSGRLIAMVSLPPGPNANHELVREGYASWDQKTARDQYSLELEEQAKAARKGIWAEPVKKSRRKG